jgi:guanine deaminase
MPPWAARAPAPDEKIGNFQPGKEADFVVIDPAVTPLQRLRSGRCKDIYEQLFVLMTLGDERNISETWVNGERVWGMRLRSSPFQARCAPREI